MLKLLCWLEADFTCTDVCNLTSTHELFNYHVLQGSKDETKLRIRKNILILALTGHDDSLMLFHDF